MAKTGLIFAASQFMVVLLCVSSNCDAKQLHAVLIADTNSNLQVSVQRDIDQLRECLEKGLPSGAIRFTTIVGNDVTSTNVLSTLRKLPVPKGDPVLVFFAGHGGFDQQGHYFWFDSLQEQVYRDSIVGAIANPVSPHFWVLVSDCCANLQPSPDSEPSAFHVPGGILLKHLFFNQKRGGIVNVNSCRPGQVASGNDAQGGLFTRSLCEVLKEHAGERMNWDQVFKETRAVTCAESELSQRSSADPHFVGRFQQQSQTPYSFRTMYGKPINNGRLGVFVTEDLLVTSLVQGGSAHRFGVSTGAQIVEVNGVNVSNKRELNDALGCSPRGAAIGLRKQYRSAKLEVELDY